MLGYPPTPPPPPGNPMADRPTRTPWVWVNKGGGPPPSLRPPKRLNTPRGRVLAGSRPRVPGTDQEGRRGRQRLSVLQEKQYL